MQPKSTIVLTDPKPVEKSDKCPRCRAGKEHREPTGGFGGPPHDVCKRCGFEFEVES